MRGIVLDQPCISSRALCAQHGLVSLGECDEDNVACPNRLVIHRPWSMVYNQCGMLLVRSNEFRHPVSHIRLGRVTSVVPSIHLSRLCLEFAGITGHWRACTHDIQLCRRHRRADSRVAIPIAYAQRAAGRACDPTLVIKSHSYMVL